MKRFNAKRPTSRLLIALCVVPWLGGCAILAGDSVPPAPALVGVEAQNTALTQGVRYGRGDEADAFVPLIEAQAAVEAARAQPGIDAHAAETLARARAALEQADDGWDAIADADERDAAGLANELAEIAANAHRARRLAEIAQYTTLREINLPKLLEVNNALQASAGGSAASPRRAGNAGQGVVEAGDALLGQQVIPDRFGAVRFETGTAQLTAGSKAVVDQLAALLDSSPDLGVAILGHTDNTAPSQAALQDFVDANPGLESQAQTQEEKTRAFNLALSAARARAVAEALVGADIATRRIGARGFGSSRPIASNDTAEGRDANRRVVAVIVPGPDSEGSPLARPSESDS